MAFIINGEEIDEEIIEAEFRQIKGHYERTLQVACCERDPEFRQTAKDNILARALLNQEAMKRYPIVSEEEVTARLTKLIESAGGEEQFYVKIGMPYRDDAVVRENVGNGVRLDKMLGTVYGDETVATEAEMLTYYEANIDSFMSEEMINASHITKGMEGATSRSDVYAAMRDLRGQLIAGADFSTMAEAQRGNDQQQIELGWFKRGEFMEEFETIAFSMEVGEVSPVFTTQLGFHICKLLERRPSAPLPFAEIKEAVASRMTEERRDKAFNAFVDWLKTVAKIEDSEQGEAAA
jgi:parvulin-like peptidyl-prolyl isomerase